MSDRSDANTAGDTGGAGGRSGGTGADGVLEASDSWRRRTGSSDKEDASRQERTIGWAIWLGHDSGHMATDARATDARATCATDARTT